MEPSYDGFFRIRNAENEIVSECRSETIALASEEIKGQIIELMMARPKEFYTGDKRSNPIRRLLLCSSKKLEYFKRKAILDWLEDKPDLKELYLYKEALHKLYRTRGYSKAKRALIRLTDMMAYSNLKDAQRLRRTLRTWMEEILGFFATGLTNARTEGFNNVAKTVQKQGYGFRNPENYRLRVLNA